MKSYQQLFAELKRRKVFRVAAVYGATAFVLLQVADVLGEGLRLPDSFLPFITAVVLIGFPLALILAWAFEVTPDGVQRTGAAAPGEIEEIVAQPASRRWPSGLLALLGLGALLAGTWWAGARTGAGDVTAAATRPDSLQLALAPAEDDRPSLAVLPFEDMSPAGDQAYFSDGITEELLNTLAKIRDLKVAARTSAFAFRDREMDMRAIGDSLGVGYLIEGSVRKAGDRLRITAQLIDGADGTHLWSEQYDRTMDDVFAIQTEIAASIADALRVPLGLDDPGGLVTPTDDLEAYDLYLAGRARIHQRGAGLREARRLFEAAVARDSTWAPAWAGLAEASELSIWYPTSWDLPAADSSAPRIAIIAGNNDYVDRLQDTAVVAARRAIELDPQNASAYVALGSVNRNRRAWEASEEAYRSALRLDPDNAEAYQQYAEMLTNRGRLPEALAASRRALELDRAPIRLMQHASTLVADDQPERALATVAEAIALDENGNVPQARWLWHRLSARLGRYGEMFVHGSGFALSVAEMDSVVQAFEEGDIDLLPAAYLENYPLGPDLLYLRLGRDDLALESIERLAREWSYGNFGIFWGPEYDALRQTPRFKEVLRGANLDDVELRRTADGEAAP